MAGADLQRGRRKRDGIGVCAVRAHGIDRALKLRRDALQRFACHRAGLPLCLQQRRADMAEAGAPAAFEQCQGLAETLTPVLEQAPGMAVGQPVPAR